MKKEILTKTCFFVEPIDRKKKETNAKTVYLPNFFFVKKINKGKRAKYKKMNTN
jgi:hypothetical protein